MTTERELAAKIETRTARVAVIGQGYVGLEYVPKPDTLKSLGWIKEYGCQMA